MAGQTAGGFLGKREQGDKVGKPGVVSSHDTPVVTHYYVIAAILRGSPVLSLSSQTF